MISDHQQKNHFGQPLPIEDVEQVLDLATQHHRHPLHLPHARAQPHRR